jgi:hypothetical protein
MAQEKEKNQYPNSRNPYGKVENINKTAKKEKKGMFSWIGNLFSKNEKQKNKRLNYDERLRKEWEQRMEANAKRYQKIAKEMKKPQYSDPTYFGHKRKPKKRPPGKKKYCDVCGIVH